MRQEDANSDYLFSDSSQRAVSRLRGVQSYQHKRLRCKASTAGRRLRNESFDHLVVEALVAAVRRLGRRTALTFPLLPPPQKN